MTAGTLSDDDPSICYSDVEKYFDRVQLRKVVSRVDLRLEDAGTADRAVVRYNGGVYLKTIKWEEILG